MAKRTSKIKEQEPTQEIDPNASSENVLPENIETSNTSDNVDFISYEEAMEIHNNIIEVHRNEVNERIAEYSNQIEIDNELREKFIREGLNTVIYEGFDRVEAISIVRSILGKQYSFTQANAEKVLVALIENGLITNVK